jgi:Flp pilus assembly pilin Flp
MKKLIQKFFKDETGAVTVDFVVLTAAVILLGGVVAATVGSGANDLANTIASDLRN